MGSGSKFKVYTNYEGIGVGFYISKFPFACTINITVLLWTVMIGIGKGYDASY